MIVCPNCNHQNPQGAAQCEACYTPLPQADTCPDCGASVLVGASFCGQCGVALACQSSGVNSAVRLTNGNAAALSADTVNTCIDPETRIQPSAARLIHVQTDTAIALPPHLEVVRIGKPNDRLAPDLDVSGFPHSEFVSRVHAEIRLDAQSYYIEDIGSSNGTYINHLPLARGNRHRLQPGDRIALGKGDLVTFVFQLV
ncbi:FHA domain-containing protein [Geitlerinema sp. CS-897]|nr:FHA domain-containing protein [Geitlerinema sp. CS-897]